MVRGPQFSNPQRMWVLNIFWNVSFVIVIVDLVSEKQQTNEIIKNKKTLIIIIIEGGLNSARSSGRMSYQSREYLYDGLMVTKDSLYPDVCLGGCPTRHPISPPKNTIIILILMSKNFIHFFFFF